MLIVKLKHSNVLQHFGCDFERSMLVTEFLCKKVQLGVEKLSISTMHGNYLKMYHGHINWISFTKPVLACSTFTNTNCSLRRQSSEHFHRGGKASEYVVKFGDLGQANFDFAKFLHTQTAVLYHLEV